jgi:cellobionic acid phosphorylase
MLKPSKNGQRYELNTPVKMPGASGYLWNRKMLIQINCRGFAVAQHLQPEPAKYSYAPNLEAKTFMQPEPAFYAHHPGRFVYIRDEESGEIFSVPYEPVKKTLDNFIFSVGKSDIEWRVEHLGLEIIFSVSLPINDPVELWTLKINNKSGRKKTLSIYPYFTIGYMSWMNQAAKYRKDLGGIVATCVTPYQKLEDYPAIKTLKDKTFFLHDTKPDAWETRRENFEGEGGLNNPDGINNGNLANGEALYETPAAVLQYHLKLEPQLSQEYRFIFGPARTDSEISELRHKYLSAKGFKTSLLEYQDYLREGQGILKIETPDADFDNLVNHWLNRQIFYHGELNRLSTDPQTRNFLQDTMGLIYFKPALARRNFLHALSQQEENGAMPDGILLYKDSELKYINQVPHTDHSVWLPICVEAYLDETGDYTLLDEPVRNVKSGDVRTVFECISAAMCWLINDRDNRGLNYIAQGDWCDPMNMVGPLGKGVSGWLSIATIYALKLWAKICVEQNESKVAEEFSAFAEEISTAVNKHLWDGNWFARGITDDNVVFGTNRDKAGKVFLNPQSFAFLAECVNGDQTQKIIEAVEKHLETPYGMMMLAPSFTSMREDIGRVTQKHPGTAENGSVYNHAAAFYIYGLYKIGESDRAFRAIRQMIPGPATEDYLRRGQMPVFIPNYYRGAYHQFPEVAGRSSQLFNTGTGSWLYRSLIEGLFGVKGCRNGLEIKPQLPNDWENAKITRHFRGATFNINYKRSKEITKPTIFVNGQPLDGNIIGNIEADRTYQVTVNR